MLPLCIAASRDDVEVLKLQEEEIQTWAELMGNGIDDDQKARDVQKLLEDFTHETNEADHNGLTPLHWAVLGRPKGDDERHAECLQLLFRRGAQIESYSNKGWTPLHYAAHSADLVGCQQLLLGLPGQEADVKAGVEETEPLLGAMIGVQDPLGQTPLHRCAIVGSTECMRAMLQCERCTADTVNIKDDMGRTVLHWCCLHNRGDMVTMLIKTGANIGAIDKAGRMPEQLAELKGHQELVDWLNNGAFPKSENPHLMKSAALVKRSARSRTLQSLEDKLRALEMEEQVTALAVAKDEVLEMTEIKPASQSQPEIFVPKVSLAEQGAAVRAIVQQLTQITEEIAATAAAAEEEDVAAEEKRKELIEICVQLEEVAEDLSPAAI